MTAYLLGLATLPVLGAVVFLLMVIFGSENSVTRRWCECGEFDVRPSESRKPWWWWDLKWSLHTHFNHTHKEGRK